MRLSSVRRVIALASTLLTIGSILLLVGTFYTADRFSIRSVTERRIVTSQGVIMAVTLDIYNAGLYAVAIDLTGRILSAQHEVVRNSSNWTVEAASGGNYTFTMQVDNATSATYLTPPAPSPVFDFMIVAKTAYGFVSIAFSGQRNMTLT